MRSVLLVGLFFGLIIMLLPNNGKKDALRLLLAVVLLISVVGGVAEEDFSLSFPEIPEAEVPVSESARLALEYAVCARVFALTGAPPQVLKCGLEEKDGGYRITSLYVVISQGDGEEVCRELKVDFSVENVVVVGGEAPRSDGRGDLPEEE